MTCNSSSESNNLGRIAGCSFSIYPMSDDFVEIILGAIRRVDMSRVWHRTDDLQTCVRGRIPHIFDVPCALFAYSIGPGRHVVFRGTFSIGCPGDIEGEAYMAATDDKPNAVLLENLPVLQTHVAGKFSVYPLGISTGLSDDSDANSYMEKIYRCIEHIKASPLEIAQTHYATRFAGELHLVWQCLEQCFQMLENEGSSHTVMEVAISVGSPTEQTEPL